jgi:fucose 4-O-acetylase-like acetyltransferase
MIEKDQDAVKKNRIYFLDNLRTFLIFLVVLNHSGLVYESSGIGGLFWIVDDPSTNNLSGILNLVIDIFIMSTLFFISGFFTPLSMRKKGKWIFLQSKFKRLLIPWIIAVLALMPLYKIIFLYSRNLPQENWTTYIYFNNEFIQSWHWFLPVLSLFDVLYVLLSKVNIDLSRITLKKAIWGIFLISLTYSYCMSIFKWQGWTKTMLLDFQNERLLIYFMFFLLGSLCYELKIFESESKSKKLYHIINGTSWIPITLYLATLIYSLIKPDDFIISRAVDQLFIRFFFHISLLSLLYSVICTFRYYLNKQGKIREELNKNSYSVYVIHVIVMGGIALTMLNTEIPSLLKYLILTVSTYVACNVTIYFYRKVIKSKI